MICSTRPREGGISITLEKKRRRDPLSDNYFQDRHHSCSSLGKQYPERKRKSSMGAIKSSDHARSASIASWAKDSAPPQYVRGAGVVSQSADELAQKLLNNKTHIISEPNQAAERRQAIAYIYKFILFRPDPTDWEDLHVVRYIMKTLQC